MVKLKLRVDLGEGRALGPGKIRLLELVAETGSISAAARAMEMSYRRAWLLVDAVNQAFQSAAVLTREGGAGGGGAVITPFGLELIACYRAMEQDAGIALKGALATLETALVRSSTEKECRSGSNGLTS